MFLEIVESRDCFMLHNVLEDASILGLRAKYFFTKISIMNTPLLEQMKTGLAAHKGRWPEIAEQAEVGYVWLFKVMQGRIRDPGVARVERVIRVLSRIHRKDNAA